MIFNDDFYLVRAREAQQLRERLERAEKDRIRRQERQVRLLEYRRAWWPILWLIVGVSGTCTALWMLAMSLDPAHQHQRIAEHVLSLLVAAGTFRIVTAHPPEQNR